MFNGLFYKNKKVLITGHTGFKGSWMCKVLEMAGADVTGYALDAPTNPSLFEMVELKNKINSIVGDIRDLHHLKKVFVEVQPEIVIHMAAQPIVRESYKNPVYTYETNVMGTVNILECVRTTSSVKSFVNVTTDKVYLNKEWQYPYLQKMNLDNCLSLILSKISNWNTDQIHLILHFPDIPTPIPYSNTLYPLSHSQMILQKRWFEHIPIY